MRTLSCPFTAECRYQTTPARTPTDLFVRKLYCSSAAYAACEIAKKILGGLPVPAGASPDGSAWGGRG